MTSPDTNVRIERHGPVAIVSLDRPDALNAFDRTLAALFDACLMTVGNDPDVRAVIVTGIGRAFSAGQDVRELARETAERGPSAVGEQLRTRYNPIILRLRNMEKPVICAMNGVTTGAGLGIALASDFRIAAESVTFGIAPLAIGLIPGVGSTALLPAVIGLSRATELAFLGERIDAARALEIGLVHRVVKPEQLLPEAHDFANRLAALPTRTIALTKQAFNAAALPNLEAQLELEAQLQEQAAATADHREGLAALLEKRTPTFTGK